MTSRAEISSRMVRAPRSEQMADPPAPARIRAVMIGAASRTVPMASTAPTKELAPIELARPPTSSTRTMPNGMAMSTVGRTETEIRNHACSANSCHTNRRRITVSPVDQLASSSMAERLPTAVSPRVPVSTTLSTVADARRTVTVQRSSPRTTSVKILPGPPASYGQRAS
jgi:hypothetical protein